MPRAREAVGRLEPEQPAADHDARRRGPRAAEMVATSPRSRKVTTPGSAMPGSGRPDRRASRWRAPAGRKASARPSRRARRSARAGRSPSTRQPGAGRCRGRAHQRGGVKRDLGRRDLAGEHAREQHAVIGGLRLGAEERDRVAAGRARAARRRSAARRHAVADDRQRAQRRSRALTPPPRRRWRA